MEAQSPEQVEVHAAPAHLRACSPCLILRWVERVEPVTARVHANTFACLNVLARGGIEVAGRRQPACFLVGPLARPRETRSHGALASASLVLAPWLVEPLFGARPTALHESVDLAEAPSDGANRLCDALAAACDRARAVDAVWRVLEDLALASGAEAPRLATEVLLAQGVAAAAAATGCSERQYRRRFERSLGLAPATWVRVRRWETSLHGLLAPGPREALAALAAQHGYADQAHLARDTRAFVQGTPAQLRSAADAGDAAWSLTPARVRILQDGEDGDA